MGRKIFLHFPNPAEGQSYSKLLRGKTGNIFSAILSTKLLILRCPCCTDRYVHQQEFSGNPGKPVTSSKTSQRHLVAPYSREHLAGRPEKNTLSQVILSAFQHFNNSTRKSAYPLQIRKTPQHVIKYQNQTLNKPVATKFSSYPLL